METVTAAEAKQKFGQLIDKAQRGPVRITKHGRSVAYLVSEKDYEEEQRQKEFHLFSMLNQGLEDIKAGRTSSLEEVKAEIFKNR